MFVISGLRHIPLLFLMAPLHAGPVFVGTTGGGKAPGKGIYRVDFDSETGALTAPVLAAEYDNAGFLALHPTKPLLYCSGRPKTAFADESSSVAAFAIEDGHGLKFLGEASSGGKGACHVAVDGSGHTVAVANYGDASFATIRLDERGVPGAAASVIVSQGSGPNASRQERAHAHGVYFNKANTYLFVPDLGIDRVLVHRFDAGTSKLGEALPPLAVAPGSGPRHLAFSADEKNAYVINELAGTVTSTNYQDGTFEILGTSSTLPEDFTGANTTAEIEVHPNGRFVYASNRGHDSIAVFRRDSESGALNFLQRADCGGKGPRHFKIEAGGRWLLCAHQGSNTVRALPLDPTTGILGEAGPAVEVPGPTCILFAR